MTRRNPLPFCQADVKRAVRGAQAGGLEVGRVEIDADGRIVLIAKTDDEPVIMPLDKWKQSRARSS